MRTLLVGWFSFKKATVVDEVRVQMVNAANNKVVREVSLRVEAKWVAKPIVLKPVRPVLKPVGPVIKPVGPVIKPIGPVLKPVGP